MAGLAGRDGLRGCPIRPGRGHGQKRRPVGHRRSRRRHRPEYHSRNPSNTQSHVHQQTQNRRPHHQHHRHAHHGFRRQLEEGPGSPRQRAAQDRHRRAEANHRRRAAKQAIRRGHQGHLHEDRLRGEHPGEQAGGKNHAARGGTRGGAGGDEADDAGDSRRLVLALLPAEPLAFPAADADRRGAGEGFHDVGSAAHPRGDRQAVHRGAGEREGAEGDAGRALRRPARQGQRARCVSPDGVRFPRARGAGVLPGGRAGRREGGG